MVSYYSVFDNVAQDFAPVFPARNDRDALRQFNASMRQAKDKQASFNPEEYELWHVFDSQDDFTKMVSDIHRVEVVDNE